jgi:TolB-like protein
MRTWMGVALALAVVTPARAQQDTRPGVAVLPFENGGSYGKSKEDYDALRLGISAIMISDLADKGSIRLVDRAETARLLDEQSLAAQGRVDAGTAARIGKLVGARYMIAGTFIDLYGEFRLDARVIDVETGEILKTVRNDPKYKNVEDLYPIIQSVADRIMAETELKALPASTRPAGSSGPAGAKSAVPTDALILYSRALLYEDRGEVSKAIEYYRKALDRFPEFTEAEAGLRKASGS